MVAQLLVLLPPRNKVVALILGLALACPFVNVGSLLISTVKKHLKFHLNCLQVHM